MRRQTIWSPNAGRICLCEFLPVPNLRYRRKHKHTHTGRHMIFLSPSSRRAINATSGSSLAAPVGLQTGVPALDTCLTTALEPSSPHSIHCSNKQCRDEPLIVKTPQKPTDRHRTQSQHQPLPAVRVGRGVLAKSIALSFPGPPREGSTARTMASRH
jgi:hypothetical protein